MLHIYNTLSRKKEQFTPLQRGKVGLYVCGITVYDLLHMGHARTYLSFDLMVRYLRHLGYEVNYVRNITDVDDNIIKRAKKNGETHIAGLESDSGGFSPRGFSADGLNSFFDEKFRQSTKFV